MKRSKPEIENENLLKEEISIIKNDKSPDILTIYAKKAIELLEDEEKLVDGQYCKDWREHNFLICSSNREDDLSNPIINFYFIDGKHLTSKHYLIILVVQHELNENVAFDWCIDSWFRDKEKFTEAEQIVEKENNIVTFDRDSFGCFYEKYKCNNNNPCKTYIVYIEMDFLNLCEDIIWS